MMLAARLARMLRNKLVLGVLVAALLLYCCCILVGMGVGSGADELTSDTDTTVRRREFHWDLDDSLFEKRQAAGAATGTVVGTGGGADNATEVQEVINTCRNSVQGKLLLADDRGYVCPRAERLGSGCCNVDSASSHRHHCLTCNTFHCCAIYEYCVSCCMHPDKKALLKRVLKQVSEGSPLYASVSDQFELCLVKCRTSSQSVQHETLYRDPRAKHCYGERLPALHTEGNA